MTKQKYILYFFTFFLTTLLVDAQNFCGTGTGDPGDPGDPGCNDNAFINSHNEDPNQIDPTTIEYDNIISGGYATIVKEANGQFKIWGANSSF